MCVTASNIYFDFWSVHLKYVYDIDYSLRWRIIIINIWHCIRYGQWWNTFIYVNNLLFALIIAFLSRFRFVPVNNIGQQYTRLLWENWKTKYNTIIYNAFTRYQRKLSSTDKLPKLLKLHWGVQTDVWSLKVKIKMKCLTSFRHEPKTT